MTSSLYRTIANAGKADGRVVVAAVRQKPVLVSHEVQTAREAICNPCEHNQGGRCKLCGCSICGQILNKTRLSTESCPAGKWPVTQVKDFLTNLKSELNSD